MTDIADLYDHEIAAIGPIWNELMQEFSRKANTRQNLEELAKRATERFQKVGLVVEVNTSPCFIVDPVTMQTGSPEIVVLGRIPGLDDAEGFDHEYKRHEVLRSKERGEKFHGQNSPVNSRKRS